VIMLGLKQMWRCLRCKNARQWGYGQPANAAKLAYLQCDNCAPGGAHVTHGFMGMNTFGGRSVE